MPFERSRSATVVFYTLLAIGLTTIVHQVSTGLGML